MYISRLEIYISRLEIEFFPCIVKFFKLPGKLFPAGIKNVILALLSFFMPTFGLGKQEDSSGRGSPRDLHLFIYI